MEVNGIYCFQVLFWMNFKIMCFLMKILGNTPSADSAKMQHEVLFFFSPHFAKKSKLSQVSGVSSFSIGHAIC